MEVVIQLEHSSTVLIRSIPMTTPEQIRAARAILGLSQPDVASAAKVSTMTIKRAEGSGKPGASADAVTAIRNALEAQGVEFLAAGQVAKGAGVAVKVSK
jgi:predicted transcriptional regulator